jgi:hypothetical protein
MAYKVYCLFIKEHVKHFTLKKLDDPFYTSQHVKVNNTEFNFSTILTMYRYLNIKNPRD